MENNLHTDKGKEEFISNYPNKQMSFVCCDKDSIVYEFMHSNMSYIITGLFTRLYTFKRVEKLSTLVYNLQDIKIELTSKTLYGKGV